MQEDKPKPTTKKAVAKKTTKTSNKKQYPKKEDGSIDWLKVIPEEFIVSQDYNKKDVPVSELKDHEKMILLGGFKFLLKERGYISKEDSIEYANFDGRNNIVICSCKIHWAAHPDSDQKDNIYTAAADAVYSTSDPNTTNVDSFMIKYLTAAAQNRAFVRAVREYLNIHIVGKDETDKITLESIVESNKGDGSKSLFQTPQRALEKLASNMKPKRNLKGAKAWLKTQIDNGEISEFDVEGVSKWDDIPKNAALIMHDYLTQKKEEENSSES